jgi:SAM-dependent methyltransferase
VLGPKRLDHIDGFRETLHDLPESEFFRWFNDSPDVESAFAHGTWDFAVYVAAPVAPFLHQPYDRVALEIGYGGGRLLLPACRAFRHVVGVDVHDRTALVSEALQARGISNFSLHIGDGRHLPVDDESVDVVYSFIVFQHLERVEIARSYLRESHRVLRSGGVAALYVGRHAYGAHASNGRVAYGLDLLLERVDPRLRPGYRERVAHVNATNLELARKFAVREAKDAGFDVLAAGRSAENWVRKRRRQHRLLLRKP